MKYLCSAVLFFISGIVFAQEADSLKAKTLSPVLIRSSRIYTDVGHMEPVNGTYLISGKKSEIINVQGRDLAVTEKYGRQIFARVPGVFVYDMDGTGNQMNISVRGLDPHRNWEFNVRKDGVITNSDMYGYPASHYNIPMEAVDRIELVRGTASLQYGAQFGGMLNFISKQPDSLRSFSFENISTVGSYGLFSSFFSASGRHKKVAYMVWANKKALSGYRHFARSAFDAQAVTLFFYPTDKIQIKAEWTRSYYQARVPGPLTDSMFYANPKYATRTRNYYSPDIHVPSVTVDWNLSKSTRFQITTSAVLGSRSSVLFDRPANIPDTINRATGEYSNRQVDIDKYRSFTSEARLLHAYSFLQRRNFFTAGVQWMSNDLHRRQLGKGTRGTDYDLTLTEPGWGRDLHFKTTNVAIFAENRWALTKRLSVNTGFRLESGETNMTGSIVYYPDDELPNTIRHRFPLFGVSAQYELTKNINLYAGWAQAYRPVIFKDIIPASVYEVTDKNLKDARGYNAEAGIRGTHGVFTFDISAFELLYRNRLGTLALTDHNNNTIIYRTNTGNSRTRGVEVLLQGNLRIGAASGISVFTATSFMDARYFDSRIRSGNVNEDISGNKVESVPARIVRSGSTFMTGRLSFTILHSYTAESFADALNTVLPSPSGAVGLVPSYHITDCSVSWQPDNQVRFMLNVNNVFNQSYFTKRPQFYPGPGIWPSDGRTYSFTVFVKI
ncbi:MAG: TonB-dependent receptor [Cyclobacteriaceae bacterium]|nr:TonB-dependent receptor [Cyclobacteriaceae bacterium]